MKNERLFREAFISNTIQLVAEGGFEIATARAIAGDRQEFKRVRLNEVYIYRIFGTKENLFAETFAVLDDELVSAIREGLSGFDAEQDFQAQYKKLFQMLWRFLAQNEKKCRYYTRYYYSSYFKGDIYRAHVQKYKIVIAKLAPAFATGVDVWPLLHQIITVMQDYAIGVYNGVVEDTEENAERVFTVVYSAIAPYLK